MAHWAIIASESSKQVSVNPIARASNRNISVLGFASPSGMPGVQTLLPLMLNHVADFYDEDVNIKSTALLSWVEPVILIFVATFIAAVLISLYMPIFSLSTVQGS